MELVYYTAGSYPGIEADDFEVMLATTADLLAAGALKNITMVDLDNKAMADGLTDYERRSSLWSKSYSD